MVLPDIRPAAAVHLLVIPRAHIPNVNSLGPTDVALGGLEGGRGGVCCQLCELKMCVWTRARGYRPHTVHASRQSDTASPERVSHERNQDCFSHHTC